MSVTPQGLGDTLPAGLDRVILGISLLRSILGPSGGAGLIRGSVTQGTDTTMGIFPSARGLVPAVTFALGTLTMTKS
jgi:hypothetical protein